MNNEKLYSELILEFSPNLKEAIKKGLSYITHSNIQNIRLKQIVTGSSSSKLYRFCVNHQNFVLRILPFVGFEKRKNEVTAHQIASKLGITPKIFYSDNQFLITIMEYINGQPLKQELLKDEKNLVHLAKMLRNLQTIECNVLQQKSQLNRAVKHYNRAKYKGAVFPSCFSKLFDQFIKESQTYQLTEIKLNHGDLHPGNILISEKSCYFIDWAYASKDHYLSDIAYLTILSGMDQSQTLAFYSTYLGKVPSEDELKRLEQAQANKCLVLATTLFDFSTNKENLKQPVKANVRRLDSILESNTLKNIQYYLTGSKCIHPRKSLPSDVELCALAFLKESLKKRQLY